MKLSDEQIGPCGKDLYVINTGDWRSLRPMMDVPKCQLCGQCWLVCPTGCIHLMGDGFGFDYVYCKGCGLCAEECGFGAIWMERESKG